MLKLTWTGTDHSRPKPAWFVPAATGRKIEATTGELINGLSHPSRDVRLTAQRRLADRSATKELVALLRDSSAPTLARTHALWALDATDGARSVRKEIIAASHDAAPIVRRQAIRQLGTRRATNAVPELRERLRDKEASVRFQAATALGHIGDPRGVPALLAALEELDLFARYAAFTALNRIGTNAPTAWATIVHGLENKSARIREGTTFALRETYDVVLLTELTELFRDTTRRSAARHAALELIAALHHQKPAWKGQWWAYHPALQPSPAKTERWIGTDLVLTTLRNGLRETDPALRRACIDGLAIARDTNSALALRDIFPRESDPASREIGRAHV